MIRGQSDKSLCRFCANELPGIHIFSELGEELCLQLKLQTCHFPVKVTVNDSLPTFMCYPCINKLNISHEFFSTGVVVQSKLMEIMANSNIEMKSTLPESNKSQDTCSFPIIDLSQDGDEDNIEPDKKRQKLQGPNGSLQMNSSSLGIEQESPCRNKKKPDLLKNGNHLPPTYLNDQENSSPVKHSPISRATHNKRVKVAYNSANPQQTTFVKKVTADQSRIQTIDITDSCTPETPAPDGSSSVTCNILLGSACTLSAVQELAISPPSRCPRAISVSDDNDVEDILSVSSGN